MAATIKVQCCTGVDAATENEVSEISYLSDDSHLSTLEERVAHPILIPQAGSDTSYEKWIRFKCTVAPDNQCTTFKIWLSTLPLDTGVQFFMKATDTGVTPTDEPVEGNFNEIETGVYDSSDHAMAISGTLINIDDETDYVVSYLKVGTTAGQGNMTTETYNYSYLEQ